MNLNPGEVNSYWWENKNHQSRWWPVWSPHHVGILPLRDCEMSLTIPYILNFLSVLHWLPFLTGTHWHDLWHFLVCCLTAVCPSPSLLRLQVVASFLEVMKFLVTSGLSLYIFLLLHLAVLHVWEWQVALLSECCPSGSTGKLDRESHQTAWLPVEAMSSVWGSWDPLGHSDSSGSASLLWPTDPCLRRYTGEFLFSMLVGVWVLLGFFGFGFFFHLETFSFLYWIPRQPFFFSLFSLNPSLITIIFKMQIIRLHGQFKKQKYDCITTYFQNYGF